MMLLKTLFFPNVVVVIIIAVVNIRLLSSSSELVKQLTPVICRISISVSSLMIDHCKKDLMTNG